MQIPSIPVLTIDGYSGSGKGTVTLRIAQQLGWHTLDSGALYRVVALAAQNHAIALDNEAALTTLAIQLEVHFVIAADLSDTQVILEKQDVTRELRTETCAAAASQVAALPLVRQALLERQRAFRQSPGLVADGRDMGTVVFPDAPVKIFLTATPEERANRRYKQLKEKGIAANIITLTTEIADRDKRDTTRSVAPLLPATDALVIDTTGITIDTVVARVLQQVSHKYADRLTPN